MYNWKSRKKWFLKLFVSCVKCKICLINLINRLMRWMCWLLNWSSKKLFRSVVLLYNWMLYFVRVSILVFSWFLVVKKVSVDSVYRFILVILIRCDKKLLFSWSKCVKKLLCSVLNWKRNRVSNKCCYMSSVFNRWNWFRCWMSVKRCW